MELKVDEVQVRYYEYLPRTGHDKVYSDQYRNPMSCAAPARSEGGDILTERSVSNFYRLDPCSSISTGTPALRQSVFK